MLIPDTFGITQVIITVHYIRKGELQVNNVYTLHPPKSDLILFYEVVEAEGENTWGGADAGQAIQWLAHAPVGSRLLVSAWDSDEEDAHLVGQTLDITEIVRAASL